MRPALPIDYLANRGLRYPEAPSDCTLAFSRGQSNRPHLRFRKLVFAVGLPAWRPAFEFSVQHIGLVCTSPKMVGANACRSITEMQHMTLFWDGAKVDQPTISVGQYRSSWAPSSFAAKVPVASTVDRSRPIPTAGRLVNVPPESVFDWKHFAEHDQPINHLV